MPRAPAQPQQVYGGHSHPYGRYPHGKRPIIIIGGGVASVTRVTPVAVPIVVPQQDNTNLQDVLERARVAATMLPNAYLQFDAFCRIADVSGDEADLERCLALGVSMPAKDRNEALFNLAKLAVFKGNFRIANAAKNRILNPVKRNLAEKLISPTTDKKTKKVAKKKGKDEKDDDA